MGGFLPIRENKQKSLSSLLQTVQMQTSCIRACGSECQQLSLELLLVQDQRFGSLRHLSPPDAQSLPPQLRLLPARLGKVTLSAL